MQYRYQYGSEGGPDTGAQKRSVALQVGTAAHAALAEYYRGNGVVAAMDAAFGSLAPNTPLRLEEFDRLEAVLANYFEFAQKNDSWKVLAVEVEAESEWKPDMRISGIIDLIIEMSGKKVIVDHKFLSRISTTSLDMDSQINYYLLLTLQLGFPIDGFLYNMIDKRKSTGNPGRRVYVTRTPNELLALGEDFYQVSRVIRATHDGQIPVYRNPTRDCRWDCSYYEACIEEMRKGR